MNSSATAEGYLFDVPQAEPVEQTLAWVHQQYRRFMELSNTRGGMLTLSQAALIIGVSRQRVQQLAAEGRFTVTEILEGRYIFGDEVLAFALTNRKSGRPPGKLKLAIAGLDRS
jgi:predicted DNA-binding protein (UPF0251 family)